MKCILNDEILGLEQAKVHITDLALLRAYGIFDFFRLVGLKPLFFKDHIERFFHSADQLRLKCPVGRKNLKAMILDIIRQNDIPDSGIRLVLTGGESPNGYSIGKPTLFAINEPINSLPAEHFTEGIKLISHEYIRDIPEIKTINYLVGIYKQPDILAQGAVDLLYHQRGKISELTRSNFFIVDQQNRIITPGKGILKGINRKHVMQLASRYFEVVEGDVFMDGLSSANEAFITGTTKKVTPVVQVDDIVIGDGKPGPVTGKLQKLFEEYINQHISEVQA